MDVLTLILALLGPVWWIILQWVSSLSYACENFLDEWLLAKLKEGEESPDEESSEAVGALVLVSAFFGIIVAAVFGLVAFFVPGQTVTINIENNLKLQALLVGILEVFWLIPYLHAINRAGAVKAAPLFQIIPVCALLIGLGAYAMAPMLDDIPALSSLISRLAEVPPVIHIIGATVIILGGLLLDFTEVEEGGWRVDGKTIGLMLLASTIIAIISFIFKDTTLEGNFVATAFWGGIGMTIGGVGIFLFYPPYRRQFLTFLKGADKLIIKAQLANETVDTMAVMTSHFAVVIGPSVMAVSAMNAWQPVFILIIGWILAKRGSKAHAELLEGKKLKQTALAISLLAIGTVLIAL